MPVVFVTGRPPRWMAEVAERTGHTGLAICANGAVVYDLHTEQVVEHHPIAGRGRARGRARGCAAAVPGVRVRGRDAGRVRPRAALRAALGRRRRARRRAGSTTIYDGPARQAAGAARGAGPGRAARRGREVVGDLVELTHSSTDGAARDLRGRGVQGERRWPGSRARHGDRRGATWWRSATCPTTWRCWPGPAPRTPWPTRTRRCSPRSTGAGRRRTTRTASPRCWSASSTSDSRVIVQTVLAGGLLSGAVGCCRSPGVAAGCRRG